MKKQRLFILLILISVLFSGKISAQVQINGVSDSTAILNELFTYRLFMEILVVHHHFSYWKHQQEMTVNLTAQISWDPPTNVASEVLLQSDAGTEAVPMLFFQVYVSDAVQCAAEVIRTGN
jgi:hypothetical protein